VSASAFNRSCSSFSYSVIGFIWRLNKGTLDETRDMDLVQLLILEVVTQMY
jgi:hypothetical protein